MIDKKIFTRELMAAEGTFAINLPCVKQIELVKKVGAVSGRDLLTASGHCEQGEAIHVRNEPSWIATSLRSSQ